MARIKRRPPSLGRIDRNSPLAAGLTFAYNFQIAKHHNAAYHHASEPVRTLPGSTMGRGGPGGFGLTISAGSGNNFEATGMVNGTARESFESGGMTVLYHRRPLTSSPASSYAFGFGTSKATYNLFAHLPWSDGTAYLNAANQELSWGGYSMTADNEEIWVASCGGLGRNLYFGDELVINGAAATLVGTTLPFQVGNFGTSGFGLELLQVCGWDRQLSHAEVSEVCRNPWGHWEDSLDRRRRILTRHTHDPGGGGGSTYTETFTESLTIDDETESGIILPASVSDSLSLSETITSQVANQAVVAESLSLDDAAASQVTLPEALAESVSFSETFGDAVTLYEAGSEDITLADSVASIEVSAEAMAEAITLTEAFDSAQGFSEALAESLSLDDAAASVVVLNGVIAESLTLDDATAAAAASNESLVETFSLDETLTPGVVITLELAESFSLDDATSGAKTVTSSITEAMTFSLTVASVLSGTVNVSVTAVKSGDVTITAALSGDVAVTATKSGDVSVNAFMVLN